MTRYAPPRDRAVLAIAGAQAADFLQGLISNDIRRLEKTPLLYTALLSPQGKILHAFFVSNRDGGGYWLDIPAQSTEDLMRRLRLYRLRADVQIEDASTAMMVALGVGAPDPRAPALGQRAIITRRDLPPARPEYDLARIAACVPDQDADFGPEEIFPADANMDLQNGVAFKKGCYVGQEVVSRMARRGGVRKRMALARFEGDAPAPGAAISAGPARLGDVRSAAGNTALALIRTDRLDKALADGVAISADGRPVTLSLPEPCS